MRAIGECVDVLCTRGVLDRQNEYFPAPAPSVDGEPYVSPKFTNIAGVRRCQQVNADRRALPQPILIHHDNLNN